MYSFSAIINNNNQLEEPQHNTYNVEINIPFTIIPHIIDNSKIEILQQMTFIGDKKFAYDLLESLSQINLDNIIYNEHHNQASSFLFSIIFSFLKKLKTNITLILNNLQLSITEYLLFDSNYLVPASELNIFYDDIDQLKSKTAILEQQIKQFSKNNNIMRS